MARGGINKAVVQIARQALLARGANPSIDAVRVELGNTGSKTTISRYLKELEATNAAHAPARERLGDTLNGLVQTLLDQLMEEGQQAISEAIDAFDRQRLELEKQITALKFELAAAQHQSVTQQAGIETLNSELATTQSSLQTELNRNAGLSQRGSDLEVLLSEKDRHIQSLEEKHVQARGALEHYREAVKEQREQDQRKHESQLHELQVEQRKLRETIAVKQDESTRLNRDNERLLGEARQHSKALHNQAAQVQTLNTRLEALRQEGAKSSGVTEHLKEQILGLRDEVKALHQAAAIIEARDRDSLARLATLQEENELLRQPGAGRLGQDAGIATPTSAESQQSTGLEKTSKRSRK